MSEGRIVIVGGGLAGDTAAATLRETGYAGDIVLVGDEPHRPYDRPPLSKAALVSPETIATVYFRPAGWYAEKGIDLRLGDGAARLDPAGHRLVLHSGAVLAYDKLLIATGARARRLRLFEETGAPVFTLRSLDDARALQPVLRPGARVTVIGGGVIGLEIAASAAALGCSVTVLELAERVMARSVSASVSHFLADYHRRKGVRVLCGTRILGIAARGGTAVIELGDGEHLTADAVIAGIGAEPNTALAQAAGLRVEDGILVDRHTRTSHPDIHAAGDVARFESARRAQPVRAEHWRHAVEQATIAARVMAGGDDIYEEEPWVWSDQYDLNLQITGEGQGEIEVLRGAFDAAAFIAFQVRQGKLVGAIAVNQPRFKRPLADLVRAQAAIDPAQLADPAVDLKKLAASF